MGYENDYYGGGFGDKVVASEQDSFSKAIFKAVGNG